MREGVIIAILSLAIVLCTGCIQLEKKETMLEEVTAVVKISFENGTVWEFRNITTKNSTVYGFLLEAARRGNFSIKSTYYGTYDSVFVESIAGVANNWSSGRFWQYWINGEYGKVGADKQKVKDSDIIEWRFALSQF